MVSALMPGWTFSTWPILVMRLLAYSLGANRAELRRELRRARAEVELRRARAEMVQLETQLPSLEQSSAQLLALEHPPAPQPLELEDQRTEETEEEEESEGDIVTSDENNDYDSGDEEVAELRRRGLLLEGWELGCSPDDADWADYNEIKYRFEL